MDLATTAVINYLGKKIVESIEILTFFSLEQRAEIDQVLVRDKGKCSSDAFINWEEVRLTLILVETREKVNVLDLFQQRNGCELPEDLKMFYLMSDGLEIRWSINPGSKSKLISIVSTIDDLRKSFRFDADVHRENVHQFIE